MIAWRRIQKVGIRFQNLQIPAGSTIAKAYIQFEVDEACSGTGHRKAKSYDGSATAAPILHVEFRPPTTASSADSAGWLLLDGSITRT